MCIPWRRWCQHHHQSAPSSVLTWGHSLLPWCVALSQHSLGETHVPRPLPNELSYIDMGTFIGDHPESTTQEIFDMLIHRCGRPIPIRDEAVRLQERIRAGLATLGPFCRKLMRAARNIPRDRNCKKYPRAVNELQRMVLLHGMKTLPQGNFCEPPPTVLVVSDEED
jgi:hypothetical protein